MKTRSILTLAIVLLISLLSASCTQNNGHIGKLFGSWSLTEMTCDGEQLTLPSGSTGGIMSFQGAVVRFNLLFGPETHDVSVATWSQLDETITFNFNHSADGIPTGTGGYAPIAWLHFSELTETVNVTELSNSHLYFWRQDKDGHIYNYKFDRTW